MSVPTTGKPCKKNFEKYLCVVNSKRIIRFNYHYINSFINLRISFHTSDRKFCIFCRNIVSAQANNKHVHDSLKNIWKYSTNVCEKLVILNDSENFRVSKFTNSQDRKKQRMFVGCYLIAKEQCKNWQRHANKCL